MCFIEVCYLWVAAYVAFGFEFHLGFCHIKQGRSWIQLISPLRSCSGLTHEGHTRDVEQVYLRCAQGFLEWLYPTGAIIVNLRPNTLSPAASLLSVCIKPSKESSGTHIYLDRLGKLRLLLREEDQAEGKVHCFSIQDGALFIEAVPQRDISRKITAFQYELVNHRPGADPQSLSGMIFS